MTLKEAIDRFDLLYPNAIPFGEKRAILSAFDGRLYAETLSLYEGAPGAFAGYGPAASPDTALLVGYPYDDIYLKLLAAENDALCGDIDRYNNSSAILNSAYEQYVGYLNRSRRRRAGPRVSV